MQVLSVRNSNGLGSLAAALRHCTALRYLDATTTRAHTDGDTAAALATSIQCMLQLRIARLNHGHMAFSAAHALVRAAASCRELRSLHLGSIVDSSPAPGDAVTRSLFAAENQAANAQQAVLGDQASVSDVTSFIDELQAMLRGNLAALAVKLHRPGMLYGSGVLAARLQAAVRAHKGVKCTGFAEQPGDGRQLQHGADGVVLPLTAPPEA